MSAFLEWLASALLVAGAVVVIGGLIYLWVLS